MRRAGSMTMRISHDRRRDARRVNRSTTTLEAVSAQPTSTEVHVTNDVAVKNAGGDPFSVTVTNPTPESSAIAR